jgi:uncharacterized protein
MKPKTWPVQDAKARFSELLETCVREGPQIVTRRGEETAVLVAMQEWKRLRAISRPSLKALLLTDFARAKLTPPPRGRQGKSMATSLYDLSVPTFLQTVKAMAGFLDRAARHCAETRGDPNDFVNARLFDDMAPFHFQIEAAWHHSVWGLEAVRTGVFSPPALIGPVPFADLQAMIRKAEAALEALIPDEVNTWAGRNLDLQIGPRRLAFTSETLILSFSLPNFYFHAVTAYDILRTRGVPLGKRDYEGRLRTRTD